MNVARRTLLQGGLAAQAVPAGAQEMPLIKLGVLTDLSGPYRDNAGPTSVLAAKQAVEDFKPESHGFRVEVLGADHQQKPDVGAAVARQWFDRDGVDAVFDLNNTAIAIAVGTVAQEKDRAMVITAAASSDLTGRYCSANSVDFAPDTYSQTHSTGGAVLRRGGKDWYLIIADYTFGHAIERDLGALIKQYDGRIVGSAAYPFPGTTDFSAFLVRAQSSGAKVLGLCNTGGDMANCVKQAREFGLDKSMTIAAIFGFINDVHAMGLQVAQGLLITETFYWDLNDRTRAWTKRFLPKTPDNYPSCLHATCYAGVTHYLKTVAAIGVPAAKASGRAAIASMKKMPTDDECFGRNSIREDGRFICPAYLFQVKTPAESKMPWDVYNLVSTTPADEAFRPLSQSDCKLVTK